MTAAIYFHPEAYTTSGQQLMGRNAAGESFLRGLFQYCTFSDFWVQVTDSEHAKAFEMQAQAFGRTEAVRVVDKFSLAKLSQPGVIYHPGPDICDHAWQRAAYGHGSWSLCGITHTTSSARVMDGLAELLAAPVQPWDALICTSNSVKEHVQCLLQVQADYLVQRLGIQKLVLPQMPIIPLGIHTQDFSFTADQKAAARSAIEVDEQTLVVLYMGRLSPHAKAHPLAMYQALETAVRTLTKGQRVVLVECGWHANEFLRKAYADAATVACPSVRVITLDGRKVDNRQTAWASADIFCSLPDNIQETFGITPIEAMASGVPVVVSDWDGYKDTVRDGVDGFRVPTLMPAAGLGTDLALRHALDVDTYDIYCGHICSLVAVDVAATAKAFCTLFASPELRHQMGDAGRQRAKEVYDWATIIPQYEDLWEQLADIRRQQGAGLTPLAHPWPARMDPFHAFSSYPTHLLTPQTVLSLVDANVHTARSRVSGYLQLSMVNFAKAVLPTEEELLEVFNAADGAPKPAADLVRAISLERQPFVFRALVWLVKLNILKVCA